MGGFGLATIAMGITYLVTNAQEKKFAGISGNFFINDAYSLILHPNLFGNPHKSINQYDEEKANYGVDVGVSMRF